jgi:hypothetical protein
VKGRGYEEEQGGPIFEHPLIHQILGKSKKEKQGLTAGMIATRFVVKKWTMARQKKTAPTAMTA